MNYIDRIEYYLKRNPELVPNGLQLEEYYMCPEFHSYTEKVSEHIYMVNFNHKLWNTTTKYGYGFTCFYKISLNNCENNITTVTI